MFIAMSLDGFIAKHNDDLSFLNMVEKEGEDYGYAEFISNVDTILLGRKTYDYVVKHIGHSHYDNGSREVYVITKTPRANVGKTVFYTGNLPALVNKLKSESGNVIYCDGGAEVINELLQNDLIDELTVSVIPLLLGEGIRLFKEGRPEQMLQLVRTKSYNTGLVQLHYARSRSKS